MARLIDYIDHLKRPSVGGTVWNRVTDDKRDEVKEFFEMLDSWPAEKPRPTYESIADLFSAELKTKVSKTTVRKWHLEKPWAAS